MSKDVRYKGRMRRLDGDPDTLAKDILRGMDLDEDPGMTNLEYLYEVSDRYKYVEIDNVLYEVEEIKEIEYGDIYVEDNGDGTYTFDVSYYNGGCCFEEAIEDGLKGCNI
jgi:hypothetical protein